MLPQHFRIILFQLIHCYLFLKHAADEKANLFFKKPLQVLFAIFFYPLLQGSDPDRASNDDGVEFIEGRNLGTLQVD